MMRKLFKNRTEAGRLLAKRLMKYAERTDVLVLALPRGGVPVAFEVARALEAPLDVFVVRKLGVPGHEELAMGAIASGGAWVLNDDVLRMLNIPDRWIDSVVASERQELERRERAYRDDLPAPEVGGRTVILVDDGIATGSSMLAAVSALRRLGPARIIVAVPVAASSTLEELSRQLDECVCLMEPDPFYAVGVWYEDFSATTDDEVRDLLHKAAFETTAAPRE
jgi:predicted phosphoribosyltransferase